MEKFLKERGLTLSVDKTRITHIDEASTSSDKTSANTTAKPLVKPSKKNTHVFLEKVRGIIGATKPQAKWR